MYDWRKINRNRFLKKKVNKYRMIGGLARLVWYIELQMIEET